MYRKNNVAKKRKINTKIRASHYLYVDNINIYIIAKAVFLLLPALPYTSPNWIIYHLYKT